MPKKQHKKEEENYLDKKRNILIEEQVVLSEERTALSFMRTGLAFIGSGIVIMNVFPNNQSTIFGWMFILIGIVLLIQYAIRLSKHRKKISELMKELENTEK